MKTTRGQEAKKSLDRIKFLFRFGRISYENAYYFSEKPLQVLNQELTRKRIEIGDKRRSKVTFISYMR